MIFAFPKLVLIEIWMLYFFSEWRLLAIISLCVFSLNQRKFDGEMIYSGGSCYSEKICL